jgi:hypothetical protein
MRRGFVSRASALVAILAGFAHRQIPGFLLFAALAFFAGTSACQAGTPIKEGSVEYQNIMLATKFLRSVGDNEMADYIEQRLRDGKIDYDPDLATPETTTVYGLGVGGQTSLDKQALGNNRSPTARANPFDEKKDFSAIAGLARTLTHEMQHTQWSNNNPIARIGSNPPFWFKCFIPSGAKGKDIVERSAWVNTIGTMQKWISTLMAKYRNDEPKYDPEVLAKMKAIADMLDTYIGDFIGENAFGYPVASWTKLKTQVGTLKKALDQLPPKTSQALQNAQDALDQVSDQITTAISDTGAISQAQCPSTTYVAVNLNYSDMNSTTTFKTATDTLKVHGDPSMVQLSGQAGAGPWFVDGQIDFAGAPSGSYTDMFPAFPAANFTGHVNSGSVYDLTLDGGYNFIQTLDLRIGGFGGYYSLSSYLYGNVGGGIAAAPVLSDHWQAARAGVAFDKAFSIADTPFVFSGSVAGLFDNLQTGAFNGNGNGVQARVQLMFPVPYLPLTGNVFAQYTDMNASGSTAGVPMSVNNQNWAVGAGLSMAIFGTPAGAAFRH